MLPELQTLRDEALRYRPTPPPLDPGAQAPDRLCLGFRNLDRTLFLQTLGFRPQISSLRP